MTTATTGFEQLTGSYTLDPAHSRIGFVARHAMVTKVRGSFNEFTGSATIDGEDPTRSAASVVIEATSIDTRNTGRDEHLRSNDFLDMASYPQISFESTAVRHVAGEDFEVTGNLTLHGVTREITLALEFQGAATDPFGNQRIGFDGSAEINRKDYGITYNAVLETGGVMVSDKIVLEFEISAIKSA